MNQNSQTVQHNASGLERPRVKIGPRSEGKKKAEIKLQKNGDVVESITVICGCGEKIVIQCVYPDAA